MLRLPGSKQNIIGPNGLGGCPYDYMDGNNRSGAAYNTNSRSYSGYDNVEKQVRNHPNVKWGGDGWLKNNTGRDCSGPCRFPGCSISACKSGYCYKFDTMSNTVYCSPCCDPETQKSRLISHGVYN